ncbi:hypothetical protein ACFV4N_20440 [Actinosynnema sp. NPDC059797]
MRRAERTVALPPPPERAPAIREALFEPDHPRIATCRQALEAVRRDLRRSGGDGP